ncbi:MAG: alpha/beta fold hydrolase, partial [Chromatiales bacterium]|nr:alpha/beta fold hydrolase [Chromatiales bacterium]
MTLYCETVGSQAADAEELVLLHGWGMNAAVWNPLLDALSDDYRMTVVELPGHGGSAYRFDQAELEAWVELVLEQAP